MTAKNWVATTITMTMTIQMTPRMNRISTWIGERDFEYDSSWDSYDCTDSVTEEGEQITSGQAYETIIDECPGCDYIYEVDVKV